MSESDALKEEEQNSNAWYVKIKLSYQGMLWQRTINHKVGEQIQHVHASKRPQIMASWLEDIYLQL